MTEEMEARRGGFAKEAMEPGNPKWAEATARQGALEERTDDIRTPFGRDATRVLHSLGYRRLKHKTQVFYAPENDHICTRIEHVSHVESVSYTVAQFLGLNTELTRAISMGHDIGHAPFGHLGERILNEMSREQLDIPFWHERNGLHFVDQIELLSDSKGGTANLNLTYAVRDGIIAHCGEISQNGLFPRQAAFSLEENYTHVNAHAPYSWEGCLVKISDKMAYLGRDIEDALKLHLLEREDVHPLLRITGEVFAKPMAAVNTTALMSLFVGDLCRNSSPEKGLCFSEEVYALMEKILHFNIENIYRHPRLKPYEQYARDILRAIDELLAEAWDGANTKEKLEAMRRGNPEVIGKFLRWIEMYWDLERPQEYRNLSCVYRVSDSREVYLRAVIDYISGMTDNFARSQYRALCSFR